jgi:pimeloyl-ACP methyl ester carboxylesterase
VHVERGWRRRFLPLAGDVRVDGRGTGRADVGVDGHARRDRRADREPHPDDDAGRGGGRRHGGPTPGLLRQLEARRLHDTFDRLPEITATTLVAAGRYDGIAPLANSEAIAARIPGARLEVFEGGHAFFFEDADAWPAIAKFLLESTDGGA